MHDDDADNTFDIVAIQTDPNRTHIEQYAGALHNIVPVVTLLAQLRLMAWGIVNG